MLCRTSPQSIQKVWHGFREHLWRKDTNKEVQIGMTHFAITIPAVESTAWVSIERNIG
jgi:hypothetical protein